MSSAESFNAAADALELPAEVRGTLGDLQRQPHVVRLAQALLSVFPAPRAAGWLSAPNKALGGRTGLDMLLSANPADAETVCRHAEYSAFNGW